MTQRRPWVPLHQRTSCSCHVGPHWKRPTLPFCLLPINLLPIRMLPLRCLWTGLVLGLPEVGLLCLTLALCLTVTP